MKRIWIFVLLGALSLGCYAQNNKYNRDKYNSQFYDCVEFGNNGKNDDTDTFLIANVGYGAKPSTSFGLTFGLMRRFGWFVSVMSGTGFHSFNTDGEFDRDETALSMPFLLGDSNKSNTRLSLIIGGLAKISKPLSIKLGVGYGINELCYEGPDKIWLLDKKYSKRGLDMSLGLQYNIKKLVLSAEVVATDFDMLEGKFGIGFWF